VDLGLAGVLWIGLLTVCGELDVGVIDAGSDGAEADPGKPQSAGPAAKDLQHLRGFGVGGDVQIGGRAPQEEVTDLAPDEPGLEPGSLEPLADLARYGTFGDELRQAGVGHATRLRVAGGNAAEV
jgi:hypothetical protein